ncbi:ATP-dependent DNA helicase RecQ [Brevibacillus agri]|uniref:RecQ family ATP-dependent DNA helicase n=1 Tax=Brevibacillus TaxID=55080 RepID=UPI000271BC17|nr:MULTISPECIES: ATP-dependent DNA helicase RecQ [Brevibacillus]ELK39277.1 ATP-dependent DNA helicase [Brevibacillus agri BAB-2500]EJL40962.1 ATP-dependent DNA helicase, RecQ family [Brevibacillus sp. CF112]MBG9568737.1 ATP-dependent DNA helicase [Brevibacillus agri]MDN4091455.1 ATP-dependent DNA helicase RecQ [Brevibacillus agri]QHZ56956.1 RecQ family ATP-dependent DNA helicase [Brevibacillus sp. NSP2.1]
MDKELHDYLKEYFGYEAFRPGQAAIIKRVLGGQSVLGLMATGGGKSVTYQLPALLLPGITVVVSPLISLMVDQVQQLRTKRRIPAAYLNSTQDPAEAREVLQKIAAGACKLLYISPEKLQQPYVQQVLGRARVSLLAIDEAHCISAWGHDFRTDYLRLPDTLKQLGNPPVLAVTATATTAVRNEICSLFGIAQEHVVVQSLNRANIAFDLAEVNGESERRQLTFELMDRLEGPGIVYCSTRQAVDVLVAAYQLDGKRRVDGYHGGMNSIERMLIQTQFLAGELDVIIATNAFGMGIDKPDIRYVIHYQMPASLEAYSQEIGRVGRDGRPGYAMLLYAQEDIQIHQYMLDKEYPTPVQIQQFIQYYRGGAALDAQALAMIDMSEEMAAMLTFYTERALSRAQVSSTHEIANPVHDIWQETEKRKAVKRKKLSEMVSYVLADSCLRKHLNQYFGEADHGYDRFCCSRCGLQRQAYEGQQPALMQPEAQNSWSLRQALDKLLPKK